MKKIFLIACISVTLSVSALAQPVGEEGLNPADKPGEKTTTPPPMDEERSKQISRYFDEALKNYEEILESRPEAESKSTEERVGALNKLLEEQQSGMGQSEGTLRVIKLAYLKQYLSLKNSYEQGLIDDKTYYQKVDALGSKYSYEIQALKQDVAYYREQSDKTGSKLKEQQEIDRVNKIFLSEAQKARPKTAIAEGPKRTPTELEMLIPRIQAVGCFQEKNFGKASDIK